MVFDYNTHEQVRSAKDYKGRKFKYNIITLSCFHTKPYIISKNYSFNGTYYKTLKDIKKALTSN